MPLNKTNLVLKAAPLDADFRGTVQELYEEMVRHLSILSPVGTNFFVVGDVEPSSNVGPWLKNGAQWWVFSQTEGRYVPADISESFPPLFFIQSTNPGTPGVNDPLVWIRTSGNRIAGLYGWDGAAWRASGNIAHSGPTTDRPSTVAELEEFFDTDINTLLRFERGAWRTAAGSPGDVKHVTHTTLAEAKRYSPGWDVLGIDDESIRGRFIGMASKDPGTNPVDSLTTGSGITPIAAGEKVGSETVILASNEIEQHTHEIGHATAMGAGQTLQLHRVDDGSTLAIPDPVPPNRWKTDNLAEGGFGAALGHTLAGSAGDGPTGTKIITANQYSKADANSLTESAQPHENRPMALFLWTLVKL